MLELTKEQKYILLALIGILISGIAYAAYDRFFKAPDAEILVAGGVTNEVSSKAKADNDFILVDISGAVRTKGVFKLRSGARMLDAVKIAGGVEPDADISQVNLAQEIKDGAKVSIPFKVAGGRGTADDKPSGQNQSAPININSADSEELKKIPGVGDVMAKRIIEYRQKNGRFTAVEDLKKVGGIGDKKLERMKDFIIVN